VDLLSQLHSTQLALRQLDAQVQALSASRALHSDPERQVDLERQVEELTAQARLLFNLNITVW
jgi:hypothetical protein